MADELFDLSELTSGLSDSRANVDRLVFVVNNYTQEEWDSIWNNPKFTYLCMSKEVGKKKGTPHIQGYLETKRCMFSTLKKQIPRANFIRADGTVEDNIRYTSKDSNPTWVQRGTPAPPKKPGRRTDLEGIAAAISEGKCSLDSLALEAPDIFCRYYKAWERCEYIHLRKQSRKWMTEGLWYYGTTGTGKSHQAFRDYDPEKCYILTVKNGWWDGYSGQPIVIINDLKPREIECGVMLNIVDKWPYKVPVRGKEAVPFLARLVIVTSSFEPTELYNATRDWKCDHDSEDQIKRRFTTIKMLQRCSGGNTSAPELSLSQRKRIEDVYKRAFPKNDSEVASEVKE